MNFLKELANTVSNTAKRVLKKETQEQTTNAIENVAQKVTETVNNVGSKIGETVKTGLDNLGTGPAPASAPQPQNPNPVPGPQPSPIPTMPPMSETAGMGPNQNNTQMNSGPAAPGPIPFGPNPSPFMNGPIPAQQAMNGQFAQPPQDMNQNPMPGVQEATNPEPPMPTPQPSGPEVPPMPTNLTFGPPPETVPQQPQEQQMTFGQPPVPPTPAPSPVPGPAVEPQPTPAQPIEITEQNKADMQKMAEGINDIFKGDIAGDIANIMEKKNIMSKEDLSNAAGAFEQGLTEQINQATDMLNQMYDKPAMENNAPTNLQGAFQNLKEASTNIGTSTSNPMGQALNDSVKDTLGSTQTFNQAVDVMSAPTDAFVNNVQQKIEDYKDLSNPNNQQ